MSAISVGKNGDVNHSAMTASQIEAALNKSANIVMTLGDNVQLDANERTIPANMMTGQPAQPVTILTATDITIDGLEGARTVNVTRILSQACPGCNDLKACAKYLNEKSVTTITVDIETLKNFNNAKRFSNIRLSSAKGERVISPFKNFFINFFVFFVYVQNYKRGLWKK